MEDELKHFLRDKRLAEPSANLLHKIILKINEIYFNLYSLVEMKSLKVGKKNLKIDATLNLDEKNKFLKNLGYDILFDIYDN